MINPKIENAHTELCKAINANRHGLGSEQTYLLLNLADTLANEGDDDSKMETMITKYLQKILPSISTFDILESASKK